MPLSTDPDGTTETLTTAGKHLLISVPDYDPTTSGVQNSYIRLGYPNIAWKLEEGADLVKYAYLVGPAGHEEDEEVKARFEALGLASKGDEFFPLFIDDQRLRGEGNEHPAGPEGHGFASAERKTRSDALQDKCGWRDHSDGNRITTTRGDKIEVVYGNYKLVVLGRQPDPGQGMGWEASGNNVQDFAGATMPGASVTVTWIKEAYLDDQVTAIPPGRTTPDALVSPSSEDVAADAEEFKEFKGGLWLLQNSTERVYQYSRNAGNFMNQEWGDLRESYTGSENPQRVGKNRNDGLQGHPQGHTVGPSPALSEPFPGTSSVGLPRGNPRIIERTWAEKIESYTGSEAWKIPEMYAETWVQKSVDKMHADSISSETHADSISEETHAGSISEETHAGSISEWTHCTGAINSKTFAEATTEVIAAAAIESHTTAVQITSVTEAANQIEVFMGLTRVDFALVAADIEIFVGKRWEMGPDATKLTLQEVRQSLSSAVNAVSTQFTSLKHSISAGVTTVRSGVVNLCGAIVNIGGPPPPTPPPAVAVPPPIP